MQARERVGSLWAIVALLALLVGGGTAWRWTHPPHQKSVLALVNADIGGPAQLGPLSVSKCDPAGFVGGTDSTVWKRDVGHWGLVGVHLVNQPVYACRLAGSVPLPELAGPNPDRWFCYAVENDGVIPLNVGGRRCSKSL